LVAAVEGDVAADAPGRGQFVQAADGAAEVAAELVAVDVVGLEQAFEAIGERTAHADRAAVAVGVDDARAVDRDEARKFGVQVRGFGEQLGAVRERVRVTEAELVAVELERRVVDADARVARQAVQAGVAEGERTAQAVAVGVAVDVDVAAFDPGIGRGVLRLRGERQGGGEGERGNDLSHV